MSTYTTTRRINVSGLTFPVVLREDSPGLITCEADVDAATLKTAIDGCPLDADTTTNAAAIRTKVQQALTANATFLAASKPGTAAAQASAAYDQTVRLTRECNALIRLVLGLLDDTTGT